MKRLDDVTARARLPASRHWVRLIMILVSALIGWSYFAELDEVSIAEGEVVPQGQVRTIQHLEGGIIEKILVKEGSRVVKGAPMVQLNVISGGTSREELSVRLDGFNLVAARLKAQAAGNRPTYDSAVVKRRPDLLAMEQRRFDAFEQEIKSTVSVLMERTNQRQLEAKQIRSRQQTLKNDLDLAREEFVMSGQLLKDGLMSKVDHLRLRREVQKLDGELTELATARPRAEAAISEAKKQMQTEIVRFRRRAGEELGKVELDIAQTREALARAADRVKRLEIRAPIDGIVKGLRYHTIGGVVRPGDPIMEIVPTQENLIIEARLNPVDIGYVRVGQTATTKISTYDYMRYGGLPSKVIDISPDSNTDASGNAYFRLVVRTDRNYLGGGPDEYPISSGMLASVDVHTGKKSVLRYLLTPVLKLKNESFRER